MDFYRRFGKRWLDVLLAGTALVLASPVIVLLAAAVACFHGRPILFAQWRPGRDGRLFRLHKFRTMAAATDPQGALLPDEQRLTPFGKLLRATSLDELPELWNVFRGDMSLVGPRPLLPEYLALYSQRERQRHDVRPGLTGLAQVSGRNSLDWPTRLALDVSYVEQHSFLLDLKILFQTVKCVLQREGISARSHATMPRFTGQPLTESPAQAA